MQAGDLFSSLAGLGSGNRVCISAQTADRRIFGQSTLLTSDSSPGAADSLRTITEVFPAELSTMLLRRRPAGRCAASWITSGTVSGVGGFDGCKCLGFMGIGWTWRVCAYYAHGSGASYAHRAWPGALGEEEAMRGELLVVSC